MLWWCSAPSFEYFLITELHLPQTINPIRFNTVHKRLCNGYDLTNELFQVNDVTWGTFTNNYPLIGATSKGCFELSWPRVVLCKFYFAKSVTKNGALPSCVCCQLIRVNWSLRYKLVLLTKQLDRGVFRSLDFILDYEPYADSKKTDAIKRLRM